MGEILLTGIDRNDIPNRSNIAVGFKHVISLCNATFT